MNLKTKEILEELKLVLKGKTLDALIPTTTFLILNGFFGINRALLGALEVALIITVFRIIKNQKIYYALVGLLGVLFATGLSYINQNATNYFLPGIVINVFFLVFSVMSLLFKIPASAVLSHLTRGWPMQWYLRSDVKPAYMEVTLFWTMYLGIRSIYLIIMYFQSDATQLGIIYTITGYPLFVLILVASYMYGIKRLKKLDCPGVDEYLERKEPPYKGQTRGF